MSPFLVFSCIDWHRRRMSLCRHASAAFAGKCSGQVHCCGSRSTPYWALNSRRHEPGSSPCPLSNTRTDWLCPIECPPWVVSDLMGGITPEQHYRSILDVYGILLRIQNKILCKEQKRKPVKKRMKKRRMRERRFELPTFACRIPKDGYECDIITTRQLALACQFLIQAI